GSRGLVDGGEGGGDGGGVFGGCGSGAWGGAAAAAGGAAAVVAATATVAARAIIAARIRPRIPRRRGVVQAPGQRDALARHVDLQHLHLDDVAGLHHLARVLHVAVRQRGDVDQAVLVHADVDEGAEGGDVRHHAFQDHAFAQVLDVLDAGG